MTDGCWRRTARLTAATAAVWLALAASGVALDTPMAQAAGAQAANATQASGESEAPGSAGAPGPAYTLPPGKLEKARAFSRIEYVLGTAEAVWDIAMLWLLLETGWAAGLERWTKRLSGRVSVQGLVFFAVLVAGTTLAGLPLRWYGHTVTLRYGISVEGWGAWTADHAKALGLSLMITVPLLLLFHWIKRRWPRTWWVWAWVVSLPLVVFGVFAAPLGDRLFNHFELLEKTDPALVAQLERMVARTGTKIPPDRIFEMRASEKSTGINAYVTGLGATKRIVVWDTTVKRIPTDEILFTFAHESGHYVLGHVMEGLAMGVCGWFFVLWVSAAGTRRLAQWRGARWDGAGSGETAEAKSADESAERGEFAGSMTGFVALLFVLLTVQFLTEPISNAFSRRMEHQADVYGQEAIHGIVPDPQATAVRTMNDLGAAWLDDPDPNRLVVLWSYSHPPIRDRAEFARQYDPWRNGGRGRYFAK